MFSIVVPTYNGGTLWKEVARSLFNILKDIKVEHEVLVIDSSSTDDTVSVAREYGFSVYIIDKKDFNHGGTRNYGVSLSRGDIIIFLTQDAIPQEYSIINLLSIFDSKSKEVALAYGRQLPHDNASVIASHARFFNYPEESYIRNKDDVSKCGIKTVFISNSFSAYRKKDFLELGGFPDDVILCEDMFLAAKAVCKNKNIAYVSNACVKHSHNYSAVEEFKRYFDIGVFHSLQPWILGSYGSAQGEGIRFIKSEFKYILKARKWTFVPIVGLNTFSKYLGFMMGKHSSCLPKPLKKMFSMHKGFWYDQKT